MLKQCEEGEGERGECGEPAVSKMLSEQVCGHKNLLFEWLKDVAVKQGILAPKHIRHL
jgi:hypothetical protein